MRQVLIQIAQNVKNLGHGSTSLTKRTFPYDKLSTRAKDVTPSIEFISSRLDLLRAGVLTVENLMRWEITYDDLLSEFTRLHN